QKPQRLMQTFVKLIFLFTTYVTFSPTFRLRSSSATLRIIFIWVPLASNSSVPCSTEISLSLKALSKVSEIAGSRFFKIESSVMLNIPPEQVRDRRIGALGGA